MAFVPPPLPITPPLPPAEPPLESVVLQPIGSLGQESYVTFHAALTDALQQARVVIIDLIWVDAVAPEGIAVLIFGMQFAESLGRELEVCSADANTYAALENERSRMRSLYFSHRTEVCDQGFNEFLTCRGRLSSITLPSITVTNIVTNTVTNTTQVVPSPFVPTPRPLPTALPAAAYTSANWHSDNVAS
jgi:anti-anti-sigma regulatory factor